MHVTELLECGNMSSDIPVHKQSRVDGDNCEQTMLSHSSASLLYVYINISLRTMQCVNACLAQIRSIEARVLMEKKQK